MVRLRRYVVVGAVVLALVGGAACSGDDGDDASSSTTSTTATSATIDAGSSTTVPTAAPGQGSLESATTAIRAACRQFYDFSFDDFSVKVSEPELAERCDAPATIEWRSDCFAERPAEFVPAVGGCALLGGHLAVWYGEQSFAKGRTFQVNGDVWTIIPETD